MTDAILYSFRRCPYAMRARMALHVSKTPLEHREILLRDKPPEMLDVSPKGTVPVLVCPDGSVIEQSIDIMRWALGRNDPENWLAGEDTALIAANDGPFKHHLDRYKYSTRHDTDPAEHRAACVAILETLEERLAAAPFLSGETRGLTDAAIMPFVRQFAHADREWFAAQPLPHVQRWLHAWLESDLFIAVMVKHPLWQAGPA
ncbi:MAG: glutathione S-transferase [Caenibius sp.]